MLEFPRLTRGAGRLEIHCLPFQEGFIIYRPLARLAFVGNHAMAGLAERLALDPLAPVGEDEQEAAVFLRSIGFLDPDPAPPAFEEAPYRPTVAVLCLTTACNLRCLYCYARGGEEPTDAIPLELGRRAIDQACANAKLKGEERFALVFHGGGEPTVALKEMRELVRHARSRSLPCHVSLATNGVWSQTVTSWALANIDEVSLSVDGLPGVQNRQRPTANGAPTFDAVLGAAKRMDAQKLPYGIRMTVTDESIEELPAGVDLLCRETGCPVFQVEPAFAHGRAARDAEALTAHERFADAFLQAYEIGASRGRHVYYSGARPWIASARFCQALDKALVVTPAGELTACYEICSSKHPLAGRFMFGTFNADGPQLRDGIRQGLLRSIAERRSHCSGCLCYWHCAGDCPSKALSPDAAQDLNFGARCELNRKITRDLLVRFIEAGKGVWSGREKLRTLADEPWI